MEGNRFIDVTDPDSERTFRFYEVEYSIACAMDGERDVDGLIHWAREELGLEPPKPADYGRMLMEVFEAVDEPKLVQPTFITQFPVAVSPLAPRIPADPGFVDRVAPLVGVT